MASNIPFGNWSVRIIYLPTSITINQLANRLQIPASRICIPRIQKATTYFAWINDFISENDAQDFASQWSNSHVFGTTIKCSVKEQKNGEVYAHQTCGKVSVSQAKTQQDRTADTQVNFNSSNGLENMQSNCSLFRASVPLMIFHSYVKKYCEYLS